MAENNPTIVEPPSKEGELAVKTRSPGGEDTKSEEEMIKKYGLKPKSVAQRKISSGKHYFDSGDYMKASSKERKQIASNPKVNMNPMNPQLARLRGKPTASKLAGPSQLGAAHHATKVEQ